MKNKYIVHSQISPNVIYGNFEVFFTSCYALVTFQEALDLEAKKTLKFAK